MFDWLDWLLVVVWYGNFFISDEVLLLGRLKKLFVGGKK